MTAKAEVIAKVENLPEEATLEDIQYRLYIREKISRSLESVRAGKTYTQSEVENLIATWRK